MHAVSQRLFDRFSYFGGIAAGCRLQEPGGLSISARGMGRLDVRLGIGRIEPYRLPRQLHGTFEQGLLLVALAKKWPCIASDRAANAWLAEVLRAAPSSAASTNRPCAYTARICSIVWAPAAPDSTSTQAIVMQVRNAAFVMG